MCRGAWSSAGGEGRPGPALSDSDEPEGRFPAGEAGLADSALYYDALVSAAYLARELGYAEAGEVYRREAADMASVIEVLFGLRPTGFRFFELRPRLPAGWDRMMLRRIRAFGEAFDLEIGRTCRNGVFVSVKRVGMERVDVDVPESGLLELSFGEGFTRVVSSGLRPVAERKDSVPTNAGTESPLTGTLGVLQSKLNE